MMRFDQQNDLDQQSEEDELEELANINNNPNSAIQINKQSQLSNIKKKTDEIQNLQLPALNQQNQRNLIEEPDRYIA